MISLFQTIIIMNVIFSYLNYFSASSFIKSLMGNIPCCTQKEKTHQSEIAPNKRVHKCPSLPVSTIKPSPNNEISTPEVNTYDALRSAVLESSKKKQISRGPENYQSRKYLGRGSFGCVVLAEQKSTGKLYAMKIIEKAKIRQFNVLQCELIKKIGHSQFLAGIKETFQNKTHIYIIMQYLPMGDIYFYLKKKQIPFNETIIRGIVAEIVVAVDILHKFGLVYRELKPQNLLVTEDGHIKLTDYGLSKVIIEEKEAVSTFVGALQFMAPEAIDGQYGQKADIWALGVLMFELMFRENPFEGQDRRGELPVQQFKASLQKNLIYSKINSKIGYMSAGFRDLLLKLLEKNPEKRISLDQMKAHDFFKQTKWRQVQERINPGPLREIIQKYDIIKFRDATTQQYIRKQIAKHRNLKANYEIQLYEFRNSQ